MKKYEFGRHILLLLLLLPLQMCAVHGIVVGFNLFFLSLSIEEGYRDKVINTREASLLLFARRKRRKSHYSRRPIHTPTKAEKELNASIHKIHGFSSSSSWPPEPYFGVKCVLHNLNLAFFSSPTWNEKGRHCLWRAIFSPFFVLNQYWIFFLWLTDFLVVSPPISFSSQ